MTRSAATAAAVTAATHAPAAVAATGGAALPAGLRVDTVHRAHHI